MAYLESILHFRSTTEWMGDSLQTSLRKDSSQASSKILSVYCIQLSSTKSQTCTSVTVERQKAIHTPTMAPAANDSHQEWREELDGWWVWGTDLGHEGPGAVPLTLALREGFYIMNNEAQLILIFMHDKQHLIHKCEELETHSTVHINCPR